MMTSDTRDTPENYYRAAHDVLDAMNALFDDGGLTVRDDTSGACLGVTYYYMARAIRNYGAVLTLCEQDYGVEAQAIIRLMLEDTIDVRYISTDPEVLSEEWWRHENRSRYYYYMKSLGEGRDPEPPSDLEELKKSIEADKREAAELAGEGATPEQVNRLLLKGRWTRLNLHERAKIADKQWDGTLKAYKFYGYLCEHSHGNAALAKDYLVPVDGDIHVALDQEGYKSVTPITLATFYAYWLLHALTSLALDEFPNLIAVAEAHVDIQSGYPDLDRDGSVNAEGL